jgi:CDP-6-deoxy-D-xylo-4-hexulose-3-dehydrase
MYYKWPLMKNNITEEDIGCVIEFLKSNPRLTQSGNVQAFEEEWSEWLGVKHSVFVSSGASANLITIATLKVLHGDGEIIVPPLTWVSDIVSVIQNGFDPVFVDINPHTLCMDTDQVISKISPRTEIT